MNRIQDDTTASEHVQKVAELIEHIEDAGYIVDADEVHTDVDVLTTTGEIRAAELTIGIPEDKGDSDE